MSAEAQQLDIQDILRQLPHRYPMLLVDRVLECVPGESIRAIKNVSYNEPFFNGHFPSRPVMPGVLILEALAQSAGVLAYRSAGVVPNEDTKLYFVGIDEARFRRPVVPGDQLLLEAKITRQLRGIWKFDARASVGGEVAASASIMVAPEVK
ncbi:MAG: 3-hydroxyacyl-ACP dehydratase FabZ [Steroidobacteraceae bacterium]